MNEEAKIELYGKYYKIFKGNGGIPEKITVVGINGDEVLIVRGHYEKQDLEDSPIKMRCNKSAIITRITDKQKAIIEKKENEIVEKEMLVSKIVNEFGVKIPLLLWCEMELEELEEYYDDLKQIEKGE